MSPNSTQDDCHVLESANNIIEIEDTSTYPKFIGSLAENIHASSMSISLDVIKRNTSTMMASWNTTNIALGLGIMGTPYATVGASWLTFPVIVVIAAICCYTGELLGECLYIRRKKGDPKYVDSDDPRDNWHQTKFTLAEIAREVWPKYGSMITTVTTVVEIFGGVILYIIVLGNSLMHIIASLTSAGLSKAACTLIFGFATLPLLMSPNMRVISSFSTIAVISLMLSIFATIVYCILEMITKDDLITTLPPMQLIEIPISMSIILFSYCGHGYMLHVQRSMKHPKSFNRMLRFSFSFAAVVKLFFGLVPAFLFQSGVKQMILNNLHSRPIFQHFAQCTIALNGYFSLPLATNVICDYINASAMEKMNPKEWDIRIAGRKMKAIAWFVFLRLFVLGIGLTIAVLVPHFALVMGLIGAVTATCLCFIFPALFHLSLFREDLNRLQVWMRYALVVFGVIVMVTGFLSSSYELYMALS